MNGNKCINCRYYEKCGKPSRPIKCMGYEPKEAAVEEQSIERHETNKTQSVNLILSTAHRPANTIRHVYTACTSRLCLYIYRKEKS